MSQYLESAKQQIANTVGTLPGKEDLTSGVQSTVANAQSGVASAKESIAQTLNDFSSKNVMNASSEFLNANSLIAKFLFLVLLLIVFLILLRIGTSIVSFFLSPSKQPYLAKGTTSGNANLTVIQDPVNEASPVLYRSNNKTGGIEFTWSTWLWIDSIGTGEKRFHIFNKGNDTYNDVGVNETSGLANVNNGPGLYLGVDSAGNPTNSLVFYLDVEKGNTQISEKPISLEITNIPLKKWFHVVYRFQNYTIDCYVNGVLAKSAFFQDSVPKQNYDDVHIGKNGGFSGKLSNLRYYDYALSAFDINAVTNYGPNLNANQNEMKNNSLFDYLGLGWYSSFGP
jgi:hypothetical protein